MKPRNYISLRLRALSAASAAAFIAVSQGIAGGSYLAAKARELAVRRRAEAEFFQSLPFIP